MSRDKKNVALLFWNTSLFFAAYNGMLPVFPPYIVFRGGTEQAVGLLVGLFSLSAVILRVYFAKLADHRGRKWLLGVAIFTCSTGPILYVFDFGLWYLALVRIYHAASLAAFMTASYTLLADFSTEENRGRLFGLYGVVSGLAMAIAPALGQFVAVNFGYTAFFVATGLLGLVMIPGQIFLKEPPVTTETEPIATVPFWDILRNRWVLISSLGLFSVTMALGALSSFLPLRALQIGLTEMGLYFAAFSLMYMVSGYVAGTLSDKYGRKAVAVPSVLFISLGLLGLTQLGGYLVLITCGLLIGFGFGAVNTALMALVMDKTTLAERSQSVSFLNNSFDLGMSSGAMLLGGVAALSFNLLWTLLSVITLVGFALILFALPKQKEEVLC